MAKDASALPADMLREQLEDLGCLDPTKNILEQQAKLKNPYTHSFPTLRNQVHLRNQRQPRRTRHLERRRLLEFTQEDSTTTAGCPPAWRPSMLEYDLDVSIGALQK